MQKKYFSQTEKCKANCENVSGKLVFDLWEKQQQQNIWYLTKINENYKKYVKLKQVSTSETISSDKNCKYLKKN